MSNIRSGRLVRSLPGNVLKDAPPVPKAPEQKPYKLRMGPVRVRFDTGTVTMSPEEFARWRINVSQATRALTSCRCHGKCQCQ